MLRSWIITVVAVAGLISLDAGAQESGVKQAFQAKFSDLAVESVAKSGMPGVYEVVADGQIFYVDEKVTHVLRGSLFDARTGTLRNLTAERASQLASQALVRAQDMAVKRVKGSGKRTLYTFEDPNCGYCKELQKELVKITDVTIYTFLLPIVSPPDSVEKSKAVWCAKDRGKAWEEVLVKSAAIGVPKGCDPPFDKIVEMAQRFGVRGTPAVYLANGQQIGGYLPSEKIEQALKSIR
jgi:thiol:disulfide interchange protein DsbC